MSTKQSEEKAVFQGNEVSKIENNKMTRIWWLGTASGVISTFAIWSIYRDFEAYLNNMPTLLALFILTGTFGMTGIFLKNIAFHFYDPIKQLLKKLTEIVFSTFGLEISFVNHRLHELVVKINLVTVGLFGLALVTFRDYDLCEKIDNFFKGLPLWVLIATNMGGVLALSWIYVSLRRKRRLQKSPLNSPSQKDTGNNMRVD